MTETRTPTPFLAADFRTTRTFATACAFVVWTVPWPYAVAGRPRPSSLYTFRRIRAAWLGVVTHPREFTEFERIPTVVSGPPAHIASLLCLPIPPSSLGFRTSTSLSESLTKDR